MKKAKIVLAMVGVLAIAGGALAFKAQRGAQIFCSTTTTTQGTATDDLTITTTLPGVLSYCTADENSPITTRTLVTVSI